MTSPYAVLANLWSETGLDTEALQHIALTGDDPVLPSSFRVGTAAQVSIGAAALAAAEIWHARTGHRQEVAVPMRAAAVEFRSERYLRVNGTFAPEPWDKIAGTYQCGDGGWVRIHTNFPHHRDGILRLLGCAYEREAVQAALSTWDAEAFEDTAAEAGLVVACMRSFAEWDAHPQGRAVAALPVLTISRIGDAHPTPFLAAPRRPLDGVRVLDLTRVIAGPVCGRTLAAHGADVLMVTAPHLPSIPTLVIDTSRGKRSAAIDLRDAEGRQTLAQLITQADVIVQSYRPGALAGYQFGPEDAARMRTGIVYVSLSAYGHAGPWAHRRGFDSLVQTASGFNFAEAQAVGETMPKALPCQALDHASGYLMALGAMTALMRRAREGGSWHVRVSLAQTAHWLRGMGRVPNGFACADPTYDDVADLLEETPSSFGQLQAVRHAASLSQTPPRWARPSVPLGTDPPAW
ncbi:MAG: CoA transferase [Ktedonobacterales bacterium]